MDYLYIEVGLFVSAVIGVIALGIWQSSGQSEGDASDYFLAGRGLTWWMVGFSLIAANISTEQFIGMSGASANFQGMAPASWEWHASVTLVVVAFFFLPRLLSTGLYTIPEFLEYRYGSAARFIIAIPAIVLLVVVTTSSVIYSGGKFVSQYYDTVPVLNNLTYMCWLIGIFAAVYVFIGGLKACAWTDLIWGASLILGGAVVAWLALDALSQADPAELIETKVANSNATVDDLESAGAWDRFLLLNDGVEGEAEAVVGENLSGGKLHMVRPIDAPEIPWIALVLGMWIPNFYYWGLNQYIVQRTLGSKSLAEGQKGIVFAAILKLLIPFIVVIPGIMAFNLFSQQLSVEGGGYDYDAAFPILVRELVKPHPMISWFVLAALCGAVISSLASMLNSASTIGTMDLYSKITGDKNEKNLVRVGQGLIVVFVLIASSLAPQFKSFESIFQYIQESQGFLSPGTLAIFLFGFFSPRTPKYFGWSAVLLNVFAYGALKFFLGEWICENGWWYAEKMAFLDRMTLCFFGIVAFGILATIFTPLKEPVDMPRNEAIDLQESKGAKYLGILVCVATVALYVIFW